MLNHDSQNQKTEQNQKPESLMDLLGPEEFEIRPGYNEKPEPPDLIPMEQQIENIKKAADILRESDDISQYKLIFSRGENTSEFPFWNNINGPIADALWHCGQVVLLRRASGNPFNSKVSVFNGKVRD